MNIVAVAACPVGIAHTYMAKKGLEQAAQKLGHSIKVEAQGAMGVENRLTPEDIAAADVAVLAVEVEIEGRERFADIKTVRVPTGAAIQSPAQLLQKVEAALKQEVSTG